MIGVDPNLSSRCRSQKDWIPRDKAMTCDDECVVCFFLVCVKLQDIHVDVPEKNKKTVYKYEFIYFILSKFMVGV